MESNVPVTKSIYNPGILHVNSVSKWIFKENQYSTSRYDCVFLLITNQVPSIRAIKSRMRRWSVHVARITCREKLDGITKYLLFYLNIGR
jgi:hypothetical protein